MTDCTIRRPNGEGNRRAALTGAEDQGMNRRVRLTVGLGRSLHNSDRIAEVGNTARAPMLRLAGPIRSAMPAYERAHPTCRVD